MPPQSALNHRHSHWPYAVHRCQLSEPAQAQLGEAVVVAVVVGYMVVVVVAVEALAGQSLAGIADSHWQLSVQTPV